MKSGEHYHPHIDGLRAVAVILVFLFHLNPELFHGGYIGVDIFFVISGLVITQSLYNEFVRTGSIHIGKFYIRRFKRLYPALLTMVSVTTVLYFFIGFLWNTNVLIKSAVTSVFAVSNLFYLKQSTEYFVKELTNPLLHTWSLGIEEQFYVIYPLLLLTLLYLFVHILKQKKLNYLALLLLIFSVGLYVLFVINEGTLWGSFYWPLARFWELGIGCALFFLSRNFVLSGPASLTLSFAGVVILLSLQLFPSLSSDLHTATLGAVFASFALIFAGLRNNSPIIKLLKLPAVVYIGILSYSLYLWHLPTIYFLHLYVPPVAYAVLVPLLTFALAYLSYTFIEVPFRQKEWVHARWFIGLGSVSAIAGLIFVLSVGPAAAIKQVNLFIEKVTQDAKEVNYIETRLQLGERMQPNYALGENFKGNYCGSGAVDYTLTASGLRKECLESKGGDTLIYLTGDSHARHFMSMLAELSLPSDLYYNEFERDAIVNWDFAEPVQTSENIEKRKDELEQLQPHYEMIYYMTSLYLDNDSEQAATIQKNLKAYTDAMSQHAEVILIAPTPVWRSGPETCALLQVNCLLNRAVHEPHRQIILSIMQELAEDNPRVHIFDVYEQICPDEECPIYSHTSDFLWYIDDNHLSIEGSEALAPYLEQWFREIFNEPDNLQASVSTN